MTGHGSSNRLGKYVGADMRVDTSGAVYLAGSYQGSSLAIGGGQSFPAPTLSLGSGTLGFVGRFWLVRSVWGGRSVGRALRRHAGRQAADDEMHTLISTYYNQRPPSTTATGLRGGHAAAHGGAGLALRLHARRGHQGPDAPAHPRAQQTPHGAPHQGTEH